MSNENRSICTDDGYTVAHPGGTCGHTHETPADAVPCMALYDPAILTRLDGETLTAEDWEEMEAAR